MGTLLILLLLGLLVGEAYSTPQVPADGELPESLGGKTLFNPTLTATCQLLQNRMVITLTTPTPFYGLLLSANQRNNSRCFVEGSGSTQTTLTLNMLASIKDQDYCGVSINYKTNEKTGQISVRQNKVLELADDKNYLVSCSKFDSPPPTSALQGHLALYDSSGREALEVVNTHLYKLRITTPTPHFRVRNCFAFSTGNKQAPLIDAAGCPETSLSRLSYTDNSAESTIYQMFRFPESRTLTINCHVLHCGEHCPPLPNCGDSNSPLLRPLSLVGSNDTDSILSTTVNVLEPGEKGEPLTLDAGFGGEQQCTGRFCPSWLLWLAIVLGVLFLLMLLVNLFLCTALTCTCTRTELVEKDPSILEDYDPYTNQYFGGGSQYNSRYSINQPKAYSDMSDHYATPSNRHEISRPNSRFSK